jgi:hypothetical protein
MKRLVSRALLATTVAMTGLSGAAATAGANTAMIGSDLTHSADANSCILGVITGCTAIQKSQAGGSQPFPLTSPANGIVTEWAIRSTDNVTYAFRILHLVIPADPDVYTGAGTALGADPGSGDGILRYPVSMPISQGDAIGIAAVSGDSDVGVPQHDTPTADSNVWATATSVNEASPPPDGSPASFAREPGHELLLQATVKFCAVPNLHRLKKVAAKQALAAADCGVRVKKKETHKRKFRGKVLKQKKPAGTTAVPGTVVPIVIGKK